MAREAREGERAVCVTRMRGEVRVNACCHRTVGQHTTPWTVCVSFATLLSFRGARTVGHCPARRFNCAHPRLISVHSDFETRRRCDVSHQPAPLCGAQPGPESGPEHSVRADLHRHPRDSRISATTIPGLTGPAKAQRALLLARHFRLSVEFRSSCAITGQRITPSQVRSPTKRRLTESMRHCSCLLSSVNSISI